MGDWLDGRLAGWEAGWMGDWLDGRLGQAAPCRHHNHISSLLCAFEREPRGEPRPLDTLPVRSLKGKEGKRTLRLTPNREQKRCARQV